MKIKKLQSVCLILACVAVTGLIGCGKTDEMPEKHEAITFMAPYLEVDSFIAVSYTHLYCGRFYELPESNCTGRV